MEYFPTLASVKRLFAWLFLLVLLVSGPLAHQASALANARGTGHSGHKRQQLHRKGALHWLLAPGCLHHHQQH